MLKQNLSYIITLCFFHLAAGSYDYYDYYYANYGYLYKSHPSDVDNGQKVSVETTLWPYDYRQYCWTSMYDCHHPASTPFPGVNWKYLNARFHNSYKTHDPWFKYPCFYYTEEALLTVLDETSTFAVFECDGRMFDRSNGTWLSRSVIDRWGTGDTFIELWNQPTQLSHFFHENNFTGLAFTSVYRCCTTLKAWRVQR